MGKYILCLFNFMFLDILRNLVYKPQTQHMWYPLGQARKKEKEEPKSRTTDKHSFIKKIFVNIHRATIEEKKQMTE